MLDRAPGFPGSEPPCDRAWKLDLRLLAIAQCGVGIPHFMRTHLLGNLERAYVAGFLDHTFNGQPAVIVGVTDREAADVEAARPGFNRGVWRDSSGLKCHPDGDRLHGGARLKSVCQRTVAQLLARQVLALVRLVTWVIGQCQYFTRDGVEHHHTACLGFVTHDRIAQFLVGHKLHLAVQAELDVFAVERRYLLAHIFNHATQAVLDDAARTCATGQLFVKSQLNTLLAAIFNIGKPHHMGSSFSLRVLPLVFLALINALDTQSADFLGHQVVHLPFDPDKILVFIGQFFIQVRQRHFQQGCQGSELGRRCIDIFRNSPNAGGRHTGRQNQAISIKNTTTTGWQLQRAGKADLPLTLEKIISEHLHISCTAGQSRKSQGNARHNELAAPHRRFAGKQGAGGVKHTFAHGLRNPAFVPAFVVSCTGLIATAGVPAVAEFAASTALSLYVTYCVMAGVVVCICKRSLASFSTRKGVACALFSTCKRSLSVSIFRLCAAVFSSSTNSRRDSY